MREGGGRPHSISLSQRAVCGCERARGEKKEEGTKPGRKGVIVLLLREAFVCVVRSLFVSSEEREGWNA